MTANVPEVAYAPLGTPKPVAENLWVVDALHRVAGLTLPVRMTVVRLSSGELWLHSPTAFNEALWQELTALGPVRHLVAPNIAHWSHLAAWQAAAPEATTWAAPGLRRRRAVRRSKLRLDHDLGPQAPRSWADEIEPFVFAGAFAVTEVAFVHRPTRTAILTDLVQSFEPNRVGRLARPLLRLAGSLAPDSRAPLHLRLVMNANRPAVAGAARRLVAAEPERVIFAHGRWFDRDGTQRLTHSLRWLLR